jgi:anti-sigma regulatory factor (Ser/Thr protein kinase)
VAEELEGANARLIEDAVLLVDELVANALVHAGTPVDVTVEQGAGYVRIEVADGTTEIPHQRDVGSDATSGRGLALVDRIASGGWGVDPTAAGKTVWFALLT